jgi:hypothetical protein
VIISASYKTDIPTFYGQWFINRVRAGFCQVYNPYSRKSYRVDLSRGSVDGFIFWTKNIACSRVSIHSQLHYQWLSQGVRKCRNRRRAFNRAFQASWRLIWSPCPGMALRHHIRNQSHAVLISCAQFRASLSAALRFYQ